MASKADELQKTLQAELLNSLSWLQVDMVYVDLTIVCGSKKFKVHKAVVCSRSPYFYAACSRGFREGEESIITLKAALDAEEVDAAEVDDPSAIENIVHFFSRQDYPKDADSSLTLTAHAKTFAAAIKYHVAGLQILSAAEVL